MIKNHILPLVLFFLLSNSLFNLMICSLIQLVIWSIWKLHKKWQVALTKWRKWSFTIGVMRNFLPDKKLCLFLPNAFFLQKNKNHNQKSLVTTLLLEYILQKTYRETYICSRLRKSWWYLFHIKNIFRTKYWLTNYSIENNLWENEKMEKLWKKSYSICWSSAISH